ncbi:hypothetical protein DSM110093_01721 [Sulfitobacter sp. DSM 110093]|nr:hypothetical protein DSM110093_01721 [Sulfitobacter sp. DSM 110093]
MLYAKRTPTFSLPKNNHAENFYLREVVKARKAGTSKEVWQSHIILPSA